MDSKYFAVPFALSGDKATVPDAAPMNGSVSYTSGYGPDYSLDPGSNPSAIDVERNKMNQIFNDITKSLGRLQQFFAPQWITSSDNDGVSFPYAEGALVLYTDGVTYQSLIAANTVTPGTDVTKWLPFLSNYATVTALDTETARAEAAEALLAPIANPTLTGVPRGPNPAPGTNTTQLATTAFTTAAVAVETARAEAAEALLAPITSPTFLSVPKAPTAAPGTNTTQIATTAFVQAASIVNKKTVTTPQTAGEGTVYGPFSLGMTTVLVGMIKLVCQAVGGDAGAAQGQYILLDSSVANNNAGIQITYNADGTTFSFGISNENGIRFFNPTTMNSGSLTLSKWTVQAILIGTA